MSLSSGILSVHNVGLKYSSALDFQCGSSLAQCPLHVVLLLLLQLRFSEDSHVAQRHKR